MPTTPGRRRVLRRPNAHRCQLLRPPRPGPATTGRRRSAAIEVDGLAVRYRDTVARAGIGFDVERDSVIGVRGPKGVDRTSTPLKAEVQRIRSKARVWRWSMRSIEAESPLDGGRGVSAADRDTQVELQDLERLATAAYLVGRDDESVDVWARAHRECARHGDVARHPLRFLVGLRSREQGRTGPWRRAGAPGPAAARGGAHRDYVEHGYMRYCASLRLAFEGDIAAADAVFAQAAKIGDRFRNPELVALAGSATAGASCTSQRSPRAWRCSTRPWWRPRRQRCPRLRLATSTAR